MTVAGPGGPRDAQVAFADPNKRKQILDMHRAGTPFLEMAQAVGVEISPEYAQLIQGLSAKDVDVIRAAMVAALEQNHDLMPYRCDLHQQIPPSLVVTSVGSAAAPEANIAPGQ